MQAVTLVLACFGGLVLLVALSRWLARRRWASLGHLALSLALLLAAAWLQPVVANLSTYQARRFDGPVAQVFCERTASHAHRITLTRLPSGHMQVFEVTGDEWRIDARTLVWQGLAVELGLRPGFRLDRLSTRFVRTPELENAAPSSYALGEEKGEDIWAQSRTGTAWSRYAVADHAYGPWLPLAEGARYEVWFEAKGLVARPANESAAKAMAASAP
jgi:hypothetical protein